MGRSWASFQVHEGPEECVWRSPLPPVGGGLAVPHCEVAVVFPNTAGCFLGSGDHTKGGQKTDEGER